MQIFAELLPHSKVCYLATGDVTKAESLYRQLHELGLRPDDAAIASIISFYGRQKQLRQALEVYASAVNSCAPGKAVYTSMIDAYCKCGKIDDATCLYREMVEQGHVPDAIIASVLVNALNKQGMHLNFNDTIEILISVVFRF